MDSVAIKIGAGLNSDTVKALTASLGFTLGSLYEFVWVIGKEVLRTPCRHASHTELRHGDGVGEVWFYSHDYSNQVGLRHIVIILSSLLHSLLANSGP